MMPSSAPRWVYRFDNYGRALARVRETVLIMDARDLSEVERDALIKRFEFTWELGWKLMKDYLEENGLKIRTAAPAPVIREAYTAKLISEADGDVWMDALESRNMTSHTYKEETAKEVIAAIRQHYLSLFESLYATLREQAEAETGSAGI